ncbi:MAG: hypothetical protein ACPMAQ_05625 [Phycisphaerae bacterium]
MRPIGTIHVRAPGQAATPIQQPYAHGADGTVSGRWHGTTSEFGIRIDIPNCAIKV